MKLSRAALTIEHETSEWLLRCDGAPHRTRKIYTIFHNAQRGGGGSGISVCRVHALELLRELERKLRRDGVLRP